MKITFNLGELPDVVSSLDAFVKIDIPAKCAFRFQKVVKYMQSELNTLKQQNDNLIRKYGQESEDKKTVQVSSENLESYRKEYLELLSEKIEVEFDPMPISLLGDCKVSTQVMSWLEKFFVDDTENV